MGCAKPFVVGLTDLLNPSGNHRGFKVIKVEQNTKWMQRNQNIFFVLTLLSVIIVTIFKWFNSQKLSLADKS